MKKIFFEKVIAGFALVMAFSVLSCATNSGFASKNEQVVKAPAFPDIYAGADNATRALLEQCDDLISQCQYGTAWGLTSNAEGIQEDYLLYKRTELATRYFCYSMMHQLFAIQDFNSIDELYEFRRNISYGGEDMEFSMIMFDPVEAAADIMERNGESAILDYTLGLYYFNVSQCYGDQWLKSEEELKDLYVEYYEKAFEQGIFTETSLETLADSYLSNRDYQNADDFLSKLNEYCPENGTYWYNRAVANMYMGNYEMTREYCRNAIKYPEEAVEYQIDAYSIYSDACEWSDDAEGAEKVLEEAVEKYPEEYTAYMYLADCYLNHEKRDKSIDTFTTGIAKFYEYAENVNLLQNVLRKIVNSQWPEDGIVICQNTLELVQGDIYSEGIAHYFEAQVYVVIDNMELASDELDKAEELMVQYGMDDAHETFQEIRSEMGL